MKITFRYLYRKYKKESINNNNSFHDILKNKSWSKSSINFKFNSYGKANFKTNNRNHF